MRILLMLFRKLASRNGGGAEEKTEERRSRADLKPRSLISAAVGVVAILGAAIEQDALRLAIGSAVNYLGDQVGLASKDTIEAEFGKQAHAMLPDGTQISANTDSKVVTRISSKGREAVLVHGEMLATIARADTPFQIVAGRSTVEASEGVVQVRQNDDDKDIVEIYVLSGEAVLYIGSSDAPPQRSLRQVAYRTVRLQAGRKATIRPTIVFVAPFELKAASDALAWVGGKIRLEDTTLTNAVAEFNRYNRHKLVIGDADIEGVQVGGQFDTTDVPSFLQSLERIYGISAVWIRPGGPRASVIVLMKAKPALHQRRQDMA